MGHRIREKGWGYWLVSLAILLGLVWGQPLVEERLDLRDAKNALFRLLTRSVTNPSTPHEVKLVWIGDPEFWGPEMQHRSPTNRFYLAKLVRAADAADAGAIALDFNLGLPGGAVRPGDYARIDPPYRAETDALARAVGEVAGRRRVVLGRVMKVDWGEELPEDRAVVLVPDAWQAYGICTAVEGDGRWRNPGTAAFPLSPAAQRNLSCGYLNAMVDVRRVPPPFPVAGAGRIDSLPLALARARAPDAPAALGTRHRYASFVPEAALRSPTMSIDAARLLADPARGREVLQGYPVVIGAAWHLEGPGEGPLVDLDDTPIGAVVGALINANLAEAVLSNRTFPALPHAAMIGIELALGAAAALLFALVPSALLATGVLVAAVPVLLFVQWGVLQLFGTFLDLFAPVLGLGLHAIIDRLVNAHET